MTSRLPAQSNTDACSYSIHLPPSTDTAAALPQLLTFAASLAQDYIWHNQPFSLQLSPLSFSASAGQTQHRHLEGKTDVTDAVDDEWYIVWLLKRITDEWQDAVVQVDDDDGEFLLIEAADELPNWVTPQNAQNRVWLYRGHLHLIPLTHKSPLPFESSSSATLNPSFDADEDAFLDRATAIELVRDENVDTRAPKEVEEAVWARISSYPDKIREHHHRTLAYLPTEIALALQESPELVAEAVKAFYGREPGTLRACNTMSRFAPSPPTTAFSPSTSSSSDLPPTSLLPVRLTRPLYSQLVLQRFYAPKPWEKAGWGDAAPAAGDGEEEKEGEKRRRGVGMKIACGFEMLYQLTKPQPRQSASAPSTYEEQQKDPAYRAFLASLADKGFFEGEVEGSEKWRVKEEQAREGWEQARGKRPTLSFAQRVDDSIALARSRPSPLPTRITDPSILSLPPAELAQCGLEDPEDWMALDEQGLEDLLAQRGGTSSSKPGGQLGDSDLEDSDEEEGMEGVEGEEGRRAQRAARRLEEMAGKVEEFVQGRGAVQGALFDDEQSADEEDDDEDETMAPPPLSAEERAARMDSLVAPLDASEWGQKEDAAAAIPSEATAPPVLAEAEPAVERPHRAPKLTEERYDGASDSDDSSEAEEEGQGRGMEELVEEEGEDAPAVVGGADDELDMGEEMDEFLRFATETLGLTAEQYEGILGERRQRGAFVPAPPAPKKTNVLPSASSPTTAAPKASGPSPAAETAAGRPPPAPAHAQARNPNLKDFDSLMEQMERELQAPKGSKPAATAAKGKAQEENQQDAADDRGPSSKPYGRQQKPAPFSGSNHVVVDSLSDSDDEGGDGEDADMAAMDAELASLLSSAGAGFAGQEGGEGGDGMDLNLVKNFLESFQAQGGFGGPAGNLAGRMGFSLPRDA
ncbi:hypothetical protein JCM10213_000233 [Rhodosporidiobolus nylandii]